MAPCNTTPKAPLIRDPADWARDWGWVSPLRAGRAAKRLRALAEIIDGAFGEDDDGVEAWVAELEEVAAYLEKNTRTSLVGRARRVNEAMRFPIGRAVEIHREVDRRVAESPSTCEKGRHR